VVNQYGAIPKPSPDGRFIAYARWYYDETSKSFTLPQIVLFDRRNGGEIQMTDGKAENWRPVFSPDGKRLAYISKRDSNFDIYEHDLSTGRERQLTNTPYDEWDPAYSSDGDRIVYAAKEDGNWDLYEMSPSDLLRRRLTQTCGDEWDPVYSPDSKRMLFAGEYGLFKGIHERRDHINAASGVRRGLRSQKLRSN
jgi:Tol biopolymer transport system component